MTSSCLPKTSSLSEFIRAAVERMGAPTSRSVAIRFYPFLAFEIGCPENQSEYGDFFPVAHSKTLPDHLK
jgi:hypothetical protein